MDKYNLLKIFQNKGMYDMPQTGKNTLLPDQALETMWVYPFPNHIITQVTQK